MSDIGYRRSDVGHERKKRSRIDLDGLFEVIAGVGVVEVVTHKNNEASV